MNGRTRRNYGRRAHSVYVDWINCSYESDTVTVPQRELAATEEQGNDEAPIELLPEKLANVGTKLNYRAVQFFGILWCRLDLDDSMDVHPPNFQLIFLQRVNST